MLSSLEVERYYPTILAVTRGYLRPEDAEDVAQESALRFARLADERRSDMEKKQYARVTAYSQVWKFREQAKREPDHCGIEDTELPWTDSVLGNLETEEAVNALVAALPSLSPRQQHVMTLYIFENLGCVAIAKRLNISRRRVSELIASATVALRGALVDLIA